MKRIGCAILIVVVVVAAVIAAFPVLHWGILGLVRGDPFYDHRPLSFWKFELTHSATGGEEVAHQLELGGADAVPILIAILQDRTLHSLHRHHAAIALGQIGPRARDAIPALQDASHDEDLLVRITAVKCLARIEKSGREQ